MADGRSPEAGSGGAGRGGGDPRGRSVPAPQRQSGRVALGRRFGWMWSAYAVSAFGTGFAFSAFPFVAILVLHAGPTQVAALAAAGALVGAAAAVPLGPWTERRAKRPVMIAMDLVRCAALLSVPAAYAAGVLGFAQLLAVAVVVAAADITFKAASGAYLKSIVAPGDCLLAANSRLESTQWTATVVGPPLGGAAIGLLGPVTTMVADAASFLLSALGLRAIGRAGEDRPAPAAKAAGGRGARRREVAEGWRFLLADPVLRPLFLNVVLFNGLLLATEPQLAVLMLDRLGFAPWQYGLAFAVPCLGGLLGSRLARRLVARYGQPAVLRTAGTLRALWPLGTAFVVPGVPGMLLIMAVEFGLIACIGVFNPVMATHRLTRIPPDRIARALSAWSVTAKTAIAALTALWGALAAVVGPRTAIAAAAALLLTTPLLLRPPRRDRGSEQPGVLLPSPADADVAG